MFASVAHAMGTAGAGQAGGADALMQFVPLIAMLAIFYFLLIRPESKKKKEAAAMRASLKVGDQITTIGGIVGTICAIKEETIVMETGADRVRIEFTKWAISSKGTQAEQDVTTQEKKDKKDK